MLTSAVMLGNAFKELFFAILPVLVLGGVASLIVKGRKGTGKHYFIIATIAGVIILMVVAGYFTSIGRLRRAVLGRNIGEVEKLLATTDFDDQYLSSLLPLAVRPKSFPETRDIDLRQKQIIVIIENLVQAGADINHPDDWGRNALFLAITDKYVEVVEFLLSRGADTNVWAYGKGEWPLRTPTSRRDQTDTDRRMAELLSEYGASYDTLRRFWTPEP